MTPGFVVLVLNLNEFVVHMSFYHVSSPFLSTFVLIHVLVGWSLPSSRFFKKDSEMLNYPNSCVLGNICLMPLCMYKHLAGFNILES